MAACWGWAEHLRRSGGRRRRWLAAAPLLFGAVLLSRPTELLQVFRDGIGTGALAIPVFAMAGGYAVAGRGRWWTRILAGAGFLLAPVGWVVTSTFVNSLGLTSPRGAWVAVAFTSYVALLALASAIPLLPATRSPLSRPRAVSPSPSGERGRRAPDDAPRRPPGSAAW